MVIFFIFLKNLKLSDGLTASEYNPETGELTVTGKATPDKYAQEMSKILVFQLIRYACGREQNF